MVDVTPPSREVLQGWAEQPLKPSDNYVPGEAEELTKRCSKVWLPLGKRSSYAAEKAARLDARERQVDLEDAVEAAGGQRGSLAA